MAELIIIGLVVLAVGFIALSGQRFSTPETKPSTAAIHNSFELAPSLFVNRSELAFYHALSRQLPPRYSIHAKVRLEDIVGVKRDIKDAKTRWALRGRVKSRHVDFLVINADGRPCLAIELDGRVHDEQGTDNADALKDGIFLACKLPLLRVKTGENFQARVSQIVSGLK